MPAEFDDRFAEVAPGYAAHRPTYPRALFEALATWCRRRRCAWDCACGSGQASHGLAAEFDRVVATDASAAQIAAALPHPRIDYRVAPAHASGLAPRSVDLVTVAQALHWLDLDAFYAEAARVLEPGGVIAVWTYAAPQLEAPDANAVLQQFERQVIGPYWPAERRHVETGYRDLPFPFVEFTPPSFVMQVEWSRVDLLGYVGTWTATQAYRRATRIDPVVDLGVRLAGVWGSERRKVRWPLHVRAGRLA
jgi:SAM-dependent methyltransferase